MIYRTIALIGLLAGQAAAAPEAVEDKVEEIADEHRRELFPVYALGSKCARRGCSVYHQISSVNPMMSVADQNNVKGPVKALEMLALNDDLNTVVQSDSM